jgi:ABC-type nickel/cobalt efflux system permease component RcnA
MLRLFPFGGSAALCAAGTKGGSMHAFLLTCKSRKRSLLLAALGALALLLGLPLRALAHPLGNFTINRYSRLIAGGEQVLLTYVVDMAEVPAWQEARRLDRNGDGAYSDEERSAWIAATLPELVARLHLSVDGHAVQWTVGDAALALPPGQAGLPTLRLEANLAAPLPSAAGELRLSFRDDNFAGRLGWQEVVVQESTGARLLASSVPQADVSDALTAYPNDLLQSPLAVHEAIFRIVPAAGAARATGGTQVAPAGTSPRMAGTDPFADLASRPLSGPGALLLAGLAAFGWGAAHAFSPGHGKAIVAAYLVGSRGTAAHALFLGVTTTVTHTAGVFSLGFLTLFAARFVAPEQLYPWLSVISGLLVVAIGVSLVWNRWRGQGHGHDHAHDNNHHHAHDHGHDHAHDHEHSHGHGGLFGHRHLSPPAEGGPLGWQGLLLLGISGGIIPCPSALVVMLAAISLQRTGFGLALIVMFSLGLASVLTAIGVTLVYAGKYFERIPERGPLLRLLPVASAVFITFAGLGITVQAILRLGFLGTI